MRDDPDSAKLLEQKSKSACLTDARIVARADPCHAKRLPGPSGPLASPSALRSSSSWSGCWPTGFSGTAGGIRIFFVIWSAALWKAKARSSRNGLSGRRYLDGRPITIPTPIPWSGPPPVKSGSGSPSTIRTTAGRTPYTSGFRRGSYIPEFHVQFGCGGRGVPVAARAAPAAECARYVLGAGARSFSARHCCAWASASSSGCAPEPGQQENGDLPHPPENRCGAGFAIRPCTTSAARMSRFPMLLRSQSSPACSTRGTNRISCAANTPPRWRISEAARWCWWARSTTIGPCA